MARFLRPAALTVLLAAGAAGCASTLHVGGDRTLNISLSEYRLRPDSVQVTSGALTIVVHNYGRLTHDLVVADGSQWLGSTRPLWPGQSAVLSLVLQPGTYSMYSSLLTDQALGDYGKLTVTS